MLEIRKCGNKMNIEKLNITPGDVIVIRTNETDEQKISLVKLAIYEGFLDTEMLCNSPHSSFKIN